MNARVICSTLLIICLSVSGCIPIPVNMYSDGSRMNVSGDTDERFTIGKTTRASVVLKLGEPDGIKDDGQQIYYQWSKEYLLGASQGGGGPLFGLDYVLLFTFNHKGVLLNTEVKKKADFF